MSLLEINSLTTFYGSIQALRGISFHMDEGQVVSLIGANGAGKSTTLNTISGLLKPHSGRVKFDNKDITGWRSDRIARLGLVQVPEGRHVIANMSVLENLTIGANQQGLSRLDVEESLNETFVQFPRLKERFKQSAGSLSGGEQQMLAVGRALMMKPRLLMLDEPSMGLAPILVNEIFDIIQQIAEQGMSILLVEQNARKALNIADYAYVLDRGEIVQEGNAKEMRSDQTIISAYLG